LESNILQSKMGGGEGIEGLYGTLACSGMHKVLECMASNCGLTSISRLVDVGAGIGRLFMVSMDRFFAQNAHQRQMDICITCAIDAYVKLDPRACVSLSSWSFF
jgi:hypothetical protein